jgi:hypothetical protein
MNTELCEVANNHHTGLAGAIKVRVEPAKDVISPASRESIRTVLDFSSMVLACVASRKQKQRSRKPRTVSFKNVCDGN